MTDNDFEQLKQSIQNLETKVDALSATSKEKRFQWKAFWIGFAIVFVIMMIFFVTIGIFSYVRVGQYSPVHVSSTTSQ